MDQQRWMLVSPEGKPIAGTLESLQGRANIIASSAMRDSAGDLEFEYEGETEIFWDDQCTVVRDSERVFLDEEGNEFLESELRLVAAEDVSGTAGGGAVARSRPTVIVLTTEGGVIHAVEGIPEGVIVRVLDLDVEGVAPERLITLPGGEKAYASEWHREEST